MTCEPGVLVLRDPATGAVREILPQPRTPHAAAFLPDGAPLAGVDDEVLVFGLAPSPDGALVAWGTNDGRLVLRRPDGTVVRLLVDGRGSIEHAVWSPDGTRLATGGGGDTAVMIFDAASGARVTPTAGHTAAVVEVDLRDDVVVTTGCDERELTWSRDGRVVDARARRHPRCRPGARETPPGPAVIERCSHSLSDGRCPGAVRLGRRWRADVDWPTALAYAPDGKTVAVAAADDVLILDMETGARLRELEGHVNNVRALAWSADGTRLASGAADGTAIIWSLR